MGIKEDFTRAFLDALPEGMAKDGFSFNAQLGSAIGAAFERVLSDRPEIHHHFDLPEGSVLNAVGNVVRVEPWGQEAARINAGLIVSTDVILRKDD